MFDKKLIQVPEYLCAAHAGASLRVFLVRQTPTLSHYSKRSRYEPKKLASGFETVLLQSQIGIPAI